MGNEMVFLLLFPKGTCPRPQPAQPVGGPLRAFQCEGRRPGTPIEEDRRSYSSPEKRGVGERNSFPHGGPGGKAPWCSFPHFSREMGPRPGGHRSRPFQRRRGKPTTAPTWEALVPALSNSAGKSLSHPPLPQKRGLFFSPFWALSHPPLTSLPVSGTMANIVSDRGSVNGYDGKL